MKKMLKITAAKENIGRAVEFIESALKATKLKRDKIFKNTLAAEEMLVQMIENAESGQSVVSISVSAGRKNVKIGISCKGAEWGLEKLEALQSGTKLSELEDEQASVISQLLLRAMSMDMSLRHSHGVNYARLFIRREAEQNNAVLLFMLAGILLGVLLRFFAPADVCTFASANIFSVGSTLFMNAVKMIVVPMVFFSIAESMTGFSDYRVFGRIGGKVMALYFTTTALAIGIAYGVFLLFKPGDPAQMNAVQAIAGMTETQSAGMTGIRELLEGIIPSNLVSAFLSGDMLQIIFIAILTGVASGTLGEYCRPVQDFIRAANSLFTRMTNMILKFLPLATLCFMASTVLTMDTGSFASLAKALVAEHAAILLMIGVYGALLAISGISPLSFFYGFRRGMLTAFTTASSSGSMPVSMKNLDAMGVSPKVYTFSIPLGATINMDGASIGFVMTVLFMMRIFSVPLDGGTLFSLFLSVMLLSIGTPGIPGASIAMTAMLFTQFGIPAGAIGFVMPLLMITDYARTMSNVTGDAVVTAIVAKSEGLLDMKKLKTKKQAG